MRFTIRSKLLAGFLSVSLFVTLVNITAYVYNDRLNHSYNDLLDRRETVLSIAEQIEYLSVQQTNSLRGYLLTQESGFLEELQTSNGQLEQRLDELGSKLGHIENNSTLWQLMETEHSFTNSSGQLVADLATNHDQKGALDYFKTYVLPWGQKLGQLSKKYADEQQQLLDLSRAKNDSMVDFVNTMTGALTVITFVLTLLIGLILSHRITSNLFKITRVITGYTQDTNTATKLPRIEVKSQDEIGDIARSFNEMAKTIEKYSMLEKEQRWLETNVAEMAVKLQTAHNLEALAQLFITTVTPLVGAGYGVFYLKQGSARRQQLNKLAAYAFQEPAFGVESFRVGDGLVGQAAAEGRTIRIDHLPEHYIRIASGLGQALPASLLIVPVLFEEQVVAVIELASFHAFGAIQQTLLQQLSTQLGSVLSSITGRMQVEHLLVESQALTEELQTQSEELQKQQEELRGINEKLEEQNKTAEQKTQELEKTKGQLEEKARQLALSSQYKSEFLANMSHELRTPLNSLLILSNILAENPSGNLNGNQVKYAQTIHQSGNDLLHLINDILDLSKVESGKIDLLPKTISMDYICEFAEQQFLPVARQKGLKFTSVLDPELPETIFTDEQRLMQIIKNLLANAFKFTERGEVKLHIHRSPGAIAFSVRDTGIGIPKDKQGVIFQAFQQGDGTTNRKYGGTGLGLSISMNIAQLLGGDIIVSSTVGQGSVFSLVLPIGQSASPALPVVLHQESAATVSGQVFPPCSRV
ncbi:ATP-binding protein [Paenibacillus albus]|uniref:Circadian input-output histidine kinase CikA n=1 Tax=Paenibacillus albus TaxID=2495582 RepID=A0A3Q8X364_9BACL|nr:ATP-binding protein [Paenibacillus albus]AZN39381.1 HAMP domain-containing protein [Paenibacillus albus]